MNSSEYNTLAISIKRWVKEKEDYELRKNKVFGISPKPYLWLFLVASVYIFFIRDYKSEESTTSVSRPFATDYVLYEKPDNESTIILKDEAKVDIHILNETKYYYEVEFLKDGTSYKGFINKSKVSR